MKQAKNKNIAIRTVRAMNYDIKLATEIERFTLALFEVTDTGENTVVLEPKENYFFAARPHITRRQLAYALRSIAYKIQHHKEGLLDEASKA